MSNSFELPTLYYRLIPEGAGIKLEIWEPAQSNEDRKAPYRFFMRYQLKSPSAAQVILDQFLINNEFGSVICVEQPKTLSPLKSMLARSKTYAA